MKVQTVIIGAGIVSDYVEIGIDLRGRYSGKFYEGPVSTSMLFDPLGKR